MTKNYGTKKGSGKKIPESQKIHITKLRNCCNRKLPLIMTRPDREFSFKIVAFEWKWRGFDWKVHISVSSVMEILYGWVLKKYFFDKKKQTQRKLLCFVNKVNSVQETCAKSFAVHFLYWVDFTMNNSSSKSAKIWLSK